MRWRESDDSEEGLESAVGIAPGFGLTSGATQDAILE